MENRSMKITPALLCFGVFCFFLPFISVSCGGQKLMSFTGIQLATGPTYQEPTMFGPAQTKKIDPEPLAYLALGAGIIGALLGFINGKPGQMLAGVCGTIGLVMLIMLKFKLESDLAKQPVLQINYETGYWGAGFVYLAGVLSSIFFSSQVKRPLPAPSPHPRMGRFCGSCGALLDADSRFCEKCGGRISS
jgi:hypothetical protein